MMDLPALFQFPPGPNPGPLALFVNNFAGAAGSPIEPLLRLLFFIKSCKFA